MKKDKLGDLVLVLGPVLHYLHSLDIDFSLSFSFEKDLMEHQLPKISILKEVLRGIPISKKNVMHSTIFEFNI